MALLTANLCPYSFYKCNFNAGCVQPRMSSKYVYYAFTQVTLPANPWNTLEVSMEFPSLVGADSLLALRCTGIGYMSQFHKACKHKNLLSTEKCCYAETGYQSKLLIFDLLCLVPDPMFAKQRIFISNLFCLKGLCTFFSHKTQCPQIYIKPTQFEDNYGRKMPLKYN